MKVTRVIVIRLVAVNFVMTEVDVCMKSQEGLLPRAYNLVYEGCALEEMTLVLDLTQINLSPQIICAPFV